jgi:glutamyl-Q tRNA(Asp) synthetase
MAALASWLDARACQGTWLLRMEDLDPPRESPAAADRILRDLEALGLHWDGPVLYQSQRHAAYDEAIARLLAAGKAYWCDCTRQMLAARQGRYSGNCRQRALDAAPGRALRFTLPDSSLDCSDLLQGNRRWQLQQELGDFIIRRKDGLHAYQLAVVVDDAFQGITQVVRGIDLLDSTPRHVCLQQALGYATPQYAHIPVLVDAKGQKLSKQSFAAPITADHPVQVLYAALQRLQQQPDPALLQADRDSLLEWAVQHWQPQRLAGLRSVPEIAAATNAGV